MAMRVLVTGGGGRLGRAAVRDLIGHGYAVVDADRLRAPADDLPAGSDHRFVETDLTDVGQVAAAMDGCGAVIHLGAIPSPQAHSPQTVFANNTGATFAVLQAAALLGVGRAVIASSLSALGTIWAPQPFLPRYAPVDEGHPLLPHDAYSLSKEVDEWTAEMFHRRTGMQIAALRFCWIASHEEIALAATAARADPAAKALEFWAYVDVRDAASACRLGIEAEGIGFGVFTVTAADTLLDQPTEAAIRRHAPAVEIRRPIAGFASACSIDRARQMLGYAPRWSWRTAETGR
ncbi:MAG: NAD-dependent epimerase/dehydratase family protein [Thermomicrobiales bacterium]